MTKWWKNVWVIDEKNYAPGMRFLFQIYKRGYITVEQFIKNNIGSYASALTYNTLLAIVPVLAIIFAIGRGFGFDNMLEQKLRKTLDFSPETADTVYLFVQSYLQHTKSGVFLGVGIIILMYTVINLTSNIETAFNTIWQVQNSRNIYRRIVDYINVFFLLPLVMVVSSGISIFMMTFAEMFAEIQFISNTVKVVIMLASYSAAPIAFTLLYKFMPNTNVHWRACLIPGLVMGILFQGMEYFYVHYQIKLSSYNAIYGSFASVPLLLIFIQLSWYLCLIGAQMSYANQSARNYAFERSINGMSRRLRDSLTLLVLWNVANRFAEGGSVLSVRRIAVQTQLPETLVQLLVDELVSVNLLAETYNARGTVRLYLPAVDVHKLTVKKVIDSLDGHGAEHMTEEWIQANPEWTRLRQLRFKGENELLLNISE